jgi:hypothetical protein
MDQDTLVRTAREGAGEGTPGHADEQPLTCLHTALTRVSRRRFTALLPGLHWLSIETWPWPFDYMGMPKPLLFVSTPVCEDLSDGGRNISDTLKSHPMHSVPQQQS